MTNADHERADTWPSGQSNEVQGGFGTPSPPSDDDADEQSADQGASGTKMDRANIDRRTPPADENEAR